MKSVVDEWNRPSGRVASWNAFNKKEKKREKKDSIYSWMWKMVEKIDDAS